VKHAKTQRIQNAEP